MLQVMIGVDPHKNSHTAVAIGLSEEPLGELQVRACPSQAGQLLAWAAGWPERAWAIEGAAGLGHLLAQQLVAAGEQVLDVPPKLAARVRMSLVDPTGQLADYSLPQCVGNYGDAQVANPAPGQWTAYIWSRDTADGGTTGPVLFGASVASYQSFGTVSASAPVRSAVMMP